MIPIQDPRRFAVTQTPVKVDFIIPTNNKMKVKESKNLDNYQDLSRELKKLWTMKVTVILIVVGVLGTVTKNLEKKPDEQMIRGRIETIQTTALLKSAKIFKRVLEI